MAEPATVVTPSTLNTTKNGATSQTQQPVEPKPAAAAPDPMAEREAVLAKREQTLKAELEKFTRSKGGLGQKLSEHAQFKKENDELRKWKAEREQEDEMGKLNPPAYLAKKYGEKWYDTIVNAHVNGVPPADLIAARVAEIERKFEAKLAERDEQVKTKADELAKNEEQETREMVRHNCTQFFEQKADDYPLLGTYGDPQRIGAALGAFIEQEFLKDGKTLLSPQEACEKLEAAEYARLEKASGSEKYRPKLQEKLKAVIVPTSSGSGAQGESQSRRTLSNHLTASTTGRAPPRSDAEREARAIEAFNAARAKSKA